MSSCIEVYERLCKEDGVTTADVCRATGIKPSAMYNWRKRGGVPRSENLQKIADYFGVTVEYMITGDTIETRADKYYLNDETAQIAQEVFENRTLRMLFDTAKDASPEDLKTVHQMLLALKRKENNG